MYIYIYIYIFYLYIFDLCLLSSGYLITSMYTKNELVASAAILFIRFEANKSFLYLKSLNWLTNI